MIIDAAGLKEENFKPADKQAFNYDKQPIVLDGRMELTISFDNRKVRTTVYVKIQAPDPLLLSGTLCQQLGIVRYHSSVRLLEKVIFK